MKLLKLIFAFEAERNTPLLSMLPKGDELMINARDMTMPVKVTPYKHQQDAYDFVMNLYGLNDGKIRSRGAALLMECGCGKTLTAIGVMGRMALSGNVKRVLVVAPLSVLGVWDEEMGKTAGFPYRLTVLKGTSKQKKEQLNNARSKFVSVVVVNYESARILRDDILRWNPDMVICDEGHKIKTHNTGISKAMHVIGAKARWRMLLTGTPVTNQAIDIFSEYKFLDPRIFGNSFYAFRNTYFYMTGYGNHTPVLRRDMQKELERRIHAIAVRKTKQECLDLPETTDVMQRVTLEPRAAKIYKQIVDDSYAELKNGEVTAANVLTRLLRLMQLTGGFLGHDDDTRVEQVSKAKLDALSDILDSMAAEGKKLVVIARFVPEIEAITHMLEKKHIGYSVIRGGVKDRDEQIRRFQEDPNTTVFVGQIQTAGMGITLTAASTMVFYSVDYNMSNYEQARARIHRAGQKEPCTYIFLVCEGTVDRKVIRALRSKQNLAKMLIDDCRAGSNPFGKE
ncbi:DEAD/DEAH box helicase [Eubacterium pyruvativorans]|uniref:DEAD/DEAH box helicase n=1 Tax=Eubacterium pyruvativorans TaxID=155865 RepID=UPI0023F531FD|nr:DEAD/DEAH box helicase [Eubacterium pyruvativorans]